VVHRGQAADPSVAALAMAVGSTILFEIFPKLIATLNLCIHEKAALIARCETDTEKQEPRDRQPGDSFLIHSVLALTNTFC